jgi:Aldolase/RraA
LEHSLTSPCQVSDALLKLQKSTPGQPAYAGYLADIVPFAASSTLLAKAKNGEKVIAPASTLKYVDKADKIDPLPADSPNAIPKGSHWADETEPGTVLVIEQPEGQTNAAIGGIMAMRMQMRGLVGCVVGGRARDLEELEDVGLPVSLPSPLSMAFQVPQSCRGQTTEGALTKCSVSRAFCADMWRLPFLLTLASSALP